jgi:CheY-like chemotaxis protein
MTKPLVVVIDDDLANAWGLSLVLQDRGYRTVIGTGIEPVTDQIDAQGLVPVAAVCDFHLEAGANGVDAGHALREHYGASIPVVIVTGSTGNTARSCAAVHDFPVLGKPVDPDALQTYLPAA